MVNKTPADLNSGTPSDTSVIHSSEDGLTDNSKKHNERDISRLQGSAPDYSASKTYALNDLVTESGNTFQNITAIVTPETFDPAKWKSFGDVVAGTGTYVNNEIPRYSGTTGKLLNIPADTPPPTMGNQGQFSNVGGIIMKSRTSTPPTTTPYLQTVSDNVRINVGLDNTKLFEIQILENTRYTFSNTEADFLGQNITNVGIFETNAGNPSTVGEIRLGNTQRITWRNSTNDGNAELRFNSSDEYSFNINNSAKIQIGINEINFLTTPLQLTEISTPTTPPANTARLYVKDDTGITTPFFLDSAGTETSLFSAFFLAPVVAATIENGALATAFESGQSIDGVTLSTGDRILIKHQTEESENGIYTVTSGSPIRTTDFDEESEVLGAVVYALQGDTQALTFWKVTNTGTIVIDTTAITFANASDSPNVINIYVPDDLGQPITAPDGVIRIPLLTGTTYNIHNDMVLPRLLVPEATPATAFNFINWNFVNPGINFLCDGDSTAHIWGRKVASMSWTDANLVDIGNSGAGNVTTLFDLVGNADNSTLATVFTGIIGFKRVGTTVDMLHNHIDAFFIDNLAGFVINNPSVSFIQTPNIRGIRTRIDSALTMERPLFTFQGLPAAIIMSSGFTSLNPGDDFLYFDSTFSSSVEIIGNSYKGAAFGNFFQASKITSILAQANADITITSFANSTENPGNDTTVNFGAIVDFTVGQVILIADEAAYNGTHTIVRVASDQQSFDINVTFATTGAGTLKMVQHSVTSNPHSRNNTLVITDTTNYNGTFAILRETDTTFHLPQAFVANDGGGTATSNPLDQTSIGIDASGNGAQQDSLTVAEARTGATLEVDGSGGVDVPVVDITPVGGDWIQDAATERFTVNTSTGEITYNGDTDIIALIEFQLTAIPSSGGSQTINFDVHINGVQQTKSIITIDTATANIGSYIGGLFSLSTGDTIQLFKNNTTNTNNTDVSVATILITGSG